MIEVISNNGKELKIKSSNGEIIFIRETEKDISISAEPFTTMAWKGKNFFDSIKMEDVSINIRIGQSISKFYELDDLLVKENGE